MPFSTCFVTQTLGARACRSAQPNVSDVHRCHVRRTKQYQTSGRIKFCLDKASLRDETYKHVSIDGQTTTGRDSLSERPASLAPRHFVNLTNGIEVLPHMSALISPSELRFTRIQSSHCESSAYEKLLASLDNELLFALACGRECYVYDFGSRNKSRGVPRALFLGLEFVKWSLSYLWFTGQQDMIPEKVLVRGKNLVPYWRDHVLRRMIEKDTKRRIRYFTPFAKEMSVRDIKLHGVYGRVSMNDGRKNVHVSMVRDWLARENAFQGQRNDGDKNLKEWLRARGLAQFRPDSTKEELVGIQNWMEGYREQV